MVEGHFPDTGVEFDDSPQPAEGQSDDEGPPDLGPSDDEEEESDQSDKDNECGEDTPQGVPPLEPQ